MEETSLGLNLGGMAVACGAAAVLTAASLLWPPPSASRPPADHATKPAGMTQYPMCFAPAWPSKSDDRASTPSPPKCVFCIGLDPSVPCPAEALEVIERTLAAQRPSPELAVPPGPAAQPTSRSSPVPGSDPLLSKPDRTDEALMRKQFRASRHKAILIALPYLRLR